MSQDSQSKVHIRPAVFPADKGIVSQLFLAYAQSLPIKLDFQGFEEELAGLPGKYAVENGGAIYLAYIEKPNSITSPETNGIPLQPRTTDLKRMAQEPKKVVGCIALRPYTPPDICELKRLYLTPESRGLGVSKLLMDVVLAKARELGYKNMLLDTLSSMTAARKLYKRYGFEEIEKYYESVEDAVFYRLVL